MDNKKNFLKDCINTVAGLEINNESQTIAKEVVLSTLESLEKENTNLKQALNEIKEYVYQNEYCRFGHIDGGEADEIYKIIDKVLGSDK